MATCSIPDDITFLEILPRLPVKSLLRFTSLSKSWHSMISSNEFTKNHLKNYSKLHKRLMLNYSGNLKNCSLESMFSKSPLFEDYSELHKRLMLDSGNLKHCDLESTTFSNEPLFDAVDTSYLFGSSKEISVSFVGSIDGLICMALDKKDLILWNPSTTKFKPLPSFGFNAFENAGLGFDKRTDDYKVVVFYSDIDTGYKLQTIVRVYSLKTNEWRTAGVVTGLVTVGDSSQFAAGELYCVAIAVTESGAEQVIMCFDLATEEYGVLKVENYVKCNYRLKLCASEGCLYFLSNNGTHTDVWIIEDYELRKLTSTTKLATTSFEHILLVYVKENGEILLRSGCGEFVVVNADDSKFKCLDTTLPGGHVTSVTYVESLVSPIV